jgi:hypothetical protein
MDDAPAARVRDGVGDMSLRVTGDKLLDNGTPVFLSIQ